MRRADLFRAAAVAAMLGAFCRPAAAQQTLDLGIETPEIHNFIGAGVGVVPDYMGYNDYTVGVAPVGRLQLGNSDRYLRLVATDLQANLINSPTFNFGPAFNYRLARKDVDDPVVDRLREIDGAFEVGAFAGFNWTGTPDPRQRFSVAIEFLHDVSGKHDGYIVTPSARYWHPVSRAVTLTLGASATYGSSSYMQTYFGIDPDNSARSGLPVFNASNGFRDVRISPGVIFSLSPQLHLAAGAIYSRLVEDASNSPVTSIRGSSDQLFAGAGVMYTW